MPYRLLADAAVLLHVAFVGFVVCGGVLVLWRKWMACVHLPAVVWGVFIELSGRICPLTPLENRLRALAGSAVYEGDFIEQYVIPVLYPPELGRHVQVSLGLFAMAVNVALYVFAWRRSRR